jgi:hypothetical protein
MFLSARLDGQLLGVAALKQLDESHGELKSLHTVEAAKAKGSDEHWSSISWRSRPIGTSGG